MNGEDIYHLKLCIYEDHGGEVLEVWVKLKIQR